MIPARSAPRSMAIELKAWRAARGWSTERAAVALDVHESTYLDWERGTPVPYPGMVETAMGMPVAKKVLQ